MDPLTLASTGSTGIDPVKMIQTSSTNFEHAVQELEDVKAKMRKVLLQFSETQKPGHQPRIEQVGSYNSIFVVLFHCVPVATKEQ